MGNTMKERLDAIVSDAEKKLAEADGLEKLNDIRVEVLGKKGALKELMKGMRDVAPEDRPKVGAMVNEARDHMTAMIEERKKELDMLVMEERMKAETIDVTLPAKKAEIGHRHPNTIALEELERIFVGMGYEVHRRTGRSSTMSTTLTKLNIPPTIRQRMSRIPSISPRISFCARRPRRFRRAAWNRAICQSA
jgi:phenylalanyl-tRNA synthetase alpha chain